MNSNAYQDLGGGQATVSRDSEHFHRYDPVSGWCGCGRRDDGLVAQGTPAWRAALAAS